MTNYLDKTGLTKLVNNIKTKLNKKVDKVDGKELSSNDFNNEYKQKLDNLSGDALIMHELPVGSIIGYDGTEAPDGWEVIEDSGDGNSSSSLGITKYKLIIEEDSAAAAEILLPGNYTVGNKSLAVYLNGERLVLSSDEAGTDGHYLEVGAIGTESNKIKLTSDWNLSAGDVLEVVIENPYWGNNQKAITATATLTQNYVYSTTESWKTTWITFNKIDEVDGLTLENGKIKIGKGISKILVSAKLGVNEALGNTAKMMITKNDMSTGKTVITHESEQYLSMVLPPQTMTVKEGDTITIAVQFSAPESSITVNADTTYLTVQAITPLAEDNLVEIPSNYLPTDTEEITDYTPTYNYHPATKKYVDDAIQAAIEEALNGSY